MRRSIILTVATALVAAACAGTATTTEGPTTGGETSTTGATAAPTTTTTVAPPEEIVLLTHDSFAISDEVLAAFEEETGTRIAVLEGGDAGTMVNQAILTRDDPIADVLYGVDNTFLSRALDEGIFEPYQAAGIDRVDEHLLDATGTVTPIDFGDVCLNYDETFFAGGDLTPPRELLDLVDPAYRGLTVVEDPATSSPGLAFLLATVARFPEGSAYDWKAFWGDLAANDVLITSGWEEAYYGAFSGGSGGGDRPIVVSYASSPPAEVYFGELEEAPTGVVTDGCFRQIEYAGVLAGTRHPGVARALVDFMLSERFQEDIPLNMFVFPANGDAELPEVFVRFTEVPDAPVIMEPATIAANREAWIAEWTRIVR